MSLSFSSANANQALILETFGLPTLAAKEKLYTPVPCCQEAKVFQIGRTDVSFETQEFETADEQNIYVIGAASYSIDATSRSGILKAYKSLVKPSKNFQNSFRSPFKQYEALETGAEEGIKKILSKLIINKMKVMTFKEVISIDLVFIDDIFELAKSDLKEYYVQLKSIKIKEVVQYNKTENEISIGHEDAVKSTVEVDDGANDADTESNHEEEEITAVTIDVVESAPPPVECDFVDEVIVADTIDDVESSPQSFDFEDAGASADISLNIEQEPEDPCARCEICSSVENTVDEETEVHSYVIKIIPEESKVSHIRKVTTTEIVMDGSATFSAESVLHVHASISADGDLESPPPEENGDDSVRTILDNVEDVFNTNQAITTDVHVDNTTHTVTTTIVTKGDEQISTYTEMNEVDHDVHVHDDDYLPEIPDTPEAYTTTTTTTVHIHGDVEIPDIPDIPDLPEIPVGEEISATVYVDPQIEIPDFSNDEVIVAAEVGDVECAPDDLFSESSFEVQTTAEVDIPKMEVSLDSQESHDSHGHVHATKTITTQVITTHMVMNEDGEVLSSEVLSDDKVNEKKIITCDGDIVSEIDHCHTDEIGDNALNDYSHTDQTVEVTKTTTKYIVSNDGTLIPTDVHLETVEEASEDLINSIVAATHGVDVNARASITISSDDIIENDDHHD